MPKADFGQPIKLGGGLFYKLKSKGDKIKFRFAAGAIYEGKHFHKREDGSTMVIFCPRIMEDLDCDTCNESFELARQAKQQENQKQRKLLEDQARESRAKIAFYYPVVDREDGRAKVLQTVLTVRQDVEEEVAAGVKVLENDYILTRTEKSPANYYSLVRAPKSIPLSAKEKQELEKAKEINIEGMLQHGGKESSVKLEKEGEITDKDIDKIDKFMNE